MAEDKQVEGEEKKSSKMIIIAAAVVLLLVGGGAGYYFFMMDDAEADGEQVEAVEELSEEEMAAANEEIYYEMSQPLIVNFPKGAGVNLIQVSVSLLVKGAETIDAINKHEPMIRNNLLMAISAKSAEDLKTKKGKEALRAMMLDEVGKVMERMTKKNNVENIFFTAFVMQ